MSWLRLYLFVGVCVCVCVWACVWFYRTEVLDFFVITCLFCLLKHKTRVGREREKTKIETERVCVLS